MENEMCTAFMIVLSYKVNSLFGAKWSCIFALFRLINTAQKLLNNNKFGISHHTTVGYIIISIGYNSFKVL